MKNKMAETNGCFCTHKLVVFMEKWRTLHTQTSIASAPTAISISLNNLKKKQNQNKLSEYLSVNLQHIHPNLAQLRQWYYELRNAETKGNPHFNIRRKSGFVQEKKIQHWGWMVFLTENHKKCEAQRANIALSLSLSLH